MNVAVNLSQEERLSVSVVESLRQQVDVCIGFDYPKREEEEGTAAEKYVSGLNMI